MKSKSFLLQMFPVILIVCLIAVSEASVKLEAPIQRVTVYTDRAMITRSTQLSLPAGDHTIIIENLPYGANNASFRGSVKGGGAILLGLNHRVVNLLEIPQENLAQLDREIYLLENYDKKRLNDRKEVFEQQKELLFAISVKSSEDMTKQLDRGGLDVAQWREAFDFVGNSLMRVNDSINATKRDLDEINKKLSKLHNDRRALGGQMALRNKVVELDVRLMQAGSIKVELNYIMTGASWRPMYDARLNEVSEKVDFLCFGEITQRTGEDWDGVDLILSTSQPSQGTGPGNLRKWVLSLLNPRPVSRVSVRGAQKGINFNAVGTSSIKTQQQIMMAPVASVADLLEKETAITHSIIHSAYNTSFSVTRKMTILSGNEAVRAPLGSYALDRSVENICRPQNRQAVYRLAKITNQDEAPLLPGKVSIFAGSDYLGSTHLNRFVAPGDDFELPFGRDNNIEVKRDIIKDKTSSVNGSFFQSDKNKIRMERTVRITLSNNGSRSVTVRVEEPLPVALDDRIKIKLKDVKPKFDEPDNNEKKEDGQAVWTIELASGEETTITMPYRIEYPAEMQITGM